MSSTFFGLEVARSALQANQTALNTVTHNIANATTEGYSRQQVVLTTNSPYMMPGMNKPTNPGQIGTGANVEQIRRLRDEFADIQYRKENKYLGEGEAKQRALEQIQLIYNEPTNDAIRGALDEFWKSLQNLSTNAEDEAVRTTVSQKALALTDNLNQTYAQLDELRKDNDAEIETVVSQINSYATQISDLNKQIIQVEVSGDKANDYRDKRDLLLDKLSKLVGIQTQEDSTGAMSVYLQGKMLVGPTTCNQMEIRIYKEDDTHDFRKVVWADTKGEVASTGGQLSGLQQVRDTIIPGLLSQLDDFTTTLATNINTIHSKGYSLDGITGLDFFAAKDTTNVTKTTSYVFNDNNTDFPTGVFTFSINGSSITIDNSTGKTNAQILSDLNTKLSAVSGLTVKMVNDNANSQTRLEIGSSTPITLDTTVASTSDSLSFLKKLGIISNDAVSGNAITAKPKLTANNITLSSDITSSLRNIAAASKQDPNNLPYPPDADGSNALAMANFKQTKVRIGAADGAPITDINGYFSSSMANLGIQAQEADSMVDNKQTLLSGLETRRQSVAGVNQDDEMTDMLKFQHGYSAAARMITTLNDIFDTIINKMGV